MKIFDGVVMKPTLSPTVQTVLSLVGLVANSFAEAKECMKKRQAEEEAGGGTTLDQVMQQAGSEIPGLQEALARLMGGGEEARQAATLIAGTPDPISLLTNFAAHYGFGLTTGKQPIVTPPPKTKARPARVGGSPTASTRATVNTSEAGVVPLKFRPEFGREGHEGTKTAEAPTPGPAKFRAEFTSEARETAQAATAANSPPAAVPAPAPSTATTTEPATSPIFDMVERLLDGLRRQDEAHRAAMAARVAQAESTVATMEEKLRVLTMEQPKAVLVVVPAPTADEVVAEASAPVEADAAKAKMDGVATAPEATEAPAPEAGSDVAAAAVIVEDAATVDAAAPTVAAQPTTSADDEARAMMLFATYLRENAQKQEEELARLATLEHRIAVVSDAYELERSRRATPLHA